MAEPPAILQLIPAPEGTDDSDETRVHLVLDIDFYSWPTLSSPLPDSIIDKVRRNRDALTLKKLVPVATGKDPKKAPGGYSYGGRYFEVGQLYPSDVTEARARAVLDRFKVEISGEGGNSSVMTGDSAYLTWGSGHAHGGCLELWVNLLLKRAEGAAFKRDLLDYGITLEDKTWKVVDTDAKTFHAGAAALSFVAGHDPEGADTRQRILTALAVIAENHGPAVTQAQWDTYMKVFFRAVPASVIASWTPEAICYVMHCHMWGQFVGWSKFAGTGGDLRKILTLEASQFSAAKGDYREVSEGRSATILRNMGHGYMIEQGIVEPLVDPPRAGDVVFKMPKGQGAKSGDQTGLPYVLRGGSAAVARSANDQIMDDIANHHHYEINALLAYLRGRGYAAVLKMRNWYASSDNPERGKFGARPLIAMDAILHANEGAPARWILDQCQWNKLPADQTGVIQRTLGITG